MVIDLIYIQINPRIYIFFEICRIFAPTFTNSIFGYFRYSLSLCFPSLVPCLFSFADDFLVVDVIFYHGSAASFVVFILVRRTPLVNGFLGVWGVWGWGRFLLWCVALHSWMLYINTKSLYCFHITALLARWFPALGNYRQEAYAPHSLPLQISSQLFQPALRAGVRLRHCWASWIYMQLSIYAVQKKVSKTIQFFVLFFRSSLSPSCQLLVIN